jgi:YihY family inner membrane protein
MRDGLGRAAREVRAGLGWFGRGLRTWCGEFLRHHGLQHAAAMSYFAILSFVPLLILLVAAFGFIVHLLGPQFGSEDRVLALIYRAADDVAPFAGEVVRERLRNLVEARQAIGAVGGTFLFIGASLVFGATETALKEIFERKPQRLLLSRALFFVFLAALALVLITLHLIRVFVGSWVEAVGDRPLLELIHAWPALDWIVSFLILGGGFVVMVVYFGHRRLTPWALFGGAALFYALFTLSRWLFSLYIAYVADLDIAYGSLATLVTGIIWVFYAATVFLLSAEFVRLCDRRLRIHAGVAAEDPHRRESDPASEQAPEVPAAASEQVPEVPAVSK